MSSLFEADIKWKYPHSTQYLTLQTSNQGWNITIGIPSRGAFVCCIKRPICLLVNVNLDIAGTLKSTSYLTDNISHRQVIIKRIPGLESPHPEYTLEPLNPLFALISMPPIHTFTLGQNFEPLAILYSNLGYSHPCIQRIPAYDSPC